ncbi:23S rRNA pseudouridine2604 synthase [Dyella jiangningensis]|uniref:rRNA pseudouridine synthase n=1 Tax=Dyella sp. AtDHG13 TaxID=1938897 RepID=UPI0008845A94|nr:rRNA pseudouridine synthase [Dyella sp. AtDHG13]PXV54090.1 pseudouridine synthase [Dyella sp. AtDHG13]SDL08407.1 23S rRNA pseudouridine2604 synthase [Dyella jiangningensis]
MTEPVRLAKRVAALAQCSRREAEMYIEGGWVRVDGVTVEEPQFKVLDQHVEIDPDARLEAAEPATLVLHKPAGMSIDEARALIRIENHAADDTSGVRALKRHFARLESPLPLPDKASGLVVFTQDWRVKRRLEEDADRIEQELVVEVAGKLAPNGLALLNHGLSFDHYALPPIKVSWLNEHNLRFALKRISPDKVERMCNAVGLTVLAIKRLRVGRIPMSRLQPGQWRYLASTDRF